MRLEGAMSEGMDDESSEMSVDETKEESRENSLEEVKEDEVTRTQDMPKEFLDSFYGLASPDSRTRSSSAHTILRYAMMDKQSAAYCFKRLLNGLCSGRAAARQGSASALQFFVKLVDIDDIQQNDGKSQGKLEYLRGRLIAVTEPDQTMGKVRGLEERDYQFGRLFGILSLVRSGILLSGEEDSVLVDLGKDLADLYNVKSWMREPAVHAIGVLLQSLCSSSDQERPTATINQIVDTVVVPILEKGDLNSKDGGETLFSTYSAEQVALLAFMQSDVYLCGLLPGSCKQAVFSAETLPLLVDSLVATSSVTQPRTHLVWDALWVFLTQRDQDESSVTTEVRRIRSKPPVGSDSCADILESFASVVIKSRLMDSTHERRALALCLVRNLLGVEFVSAITGRTRLMLEDDLLERAILSSDVIQKLFVDIICAGGGTQSSHLLKPLALHILEQMVSSTESRTRRCNLAKALIRCESRFDGRTKTDTVASLLQLKSAPTADTLSDWYEIVASLEEHIFRIEASNINFGLGVVELLFKLGKALAVGKSNEEADEKKTRIALAGRILSSMSIASFFDCSTLKNVSKASKSANLFLSTACALKSHRTGLMPILPYSVRLSMSSRFYSLLSERVTIILRSITDGKEMEALGLIADLQQGFESLLSKGASQIYAAVPSEKVEVDEEPGAIVSGLTSDAKRLKKEGNELASKFSCCAALLASLLRLQLVLASPTEETPETEKDSPVDDSHDADQILDSLGDIKQISSLVLTNTAETGSPAQGLAELCISILTSPFTDRNQGTGSAPKLIRELVKLVWTAGLKVLTSYKDAILDQTVMRTLLAGVGVHQDEDSDGSASGEDESDGDSESDQDSSQNSDNSDAEATDENSTEARDEDGGDVELNLSSLQTFLEDDSDASVHETDLEHHEGADAALAMLIQQRQGVRKAGQQERERIAISNNQRCLVLLETAIVGKPSGWGGLLRVDELLQTVVPLIQYRRELEKSIKTGPDNSVGRSEKQGFVDSLTSVLKNKLFKIKPLALAWTKDFDQSSLIRTTAEILVSEMSTKSSEQHQGLCNGALLFALKCTADLSLKISVAQVYEKVVDQWANKKIDCPKSNLWETLVHSHGSLAQVVLVKPMIEAASNAKSSYLRAEAYRILAVMYNSKLMSDDDELKTNALQRLDTTAGEVLNSLCNALRTDDDMKKAKRARELLLAFGKILNYALERADESDEVSVACSGVEKALDEVGQASDSHGIVQTCAKLAEDVGKLAAKMSARKPSNPSSSSKKKKKRRN